MIHILDYKPDARTNKPIAQLAVYSLALTRLVPGLRLFDIKCAWFNENCYNEFFPRLLLPRPEKTLSGCAGPARSDQSGLDTILTKEKQVLIHDISRTY